MEIPTVKIEQYHQNRIEFAQQLGQALENVGVAQVSGLEQQLVNDLYGYLQQNIAKLPYGGKYLGKCFHQYTIQLLPSEDLSGNTEDDLEPEAFFIDQLIGKTKRNISKITSAISNSYGTIKNPQPILIGYCKGSKMYSPDNRKKIMISEHHDDTALTFAAPASAPGLEGKIKGRWMPLQAEPGHLLVWPGDRFKSIPHGEIKPLWHRVQYPTTERWALLFS